MVAKKLFGVMATVVIVSLVVLPACTGVSEARPSPAPAEGGADGEPDPLSWIRDLLASIDLRATVQWVIDNLDIIELVGALLAGWIVNGVKSARGLAVGLMLDTEKRAKEQVEMGGPSMRRRSRAWRRGWQPSVTPADGSGSTAWPRSSATCR